MPLPRTQARGSLTTVGLGVGEISEVGFFVDPAVNEPKVRGQQPAAGARVPLGARIAITVAVPGVRVPQLVRRTVSEAQGLLREAGLTLKSADTLPKSSVVTNQVPSGGRVVRAGEVVIVTVRAASRPDAAAIAVPSVIGLHFEEAIEVFRQQGFTRVRPQPKLDRSPRGQVLSQSPEAGKQVTPDTGLSFFYGTATVSLRAKDRIANREQAAALCPAVCAAVQAKWSEWFPEKPDQCYCSLQ
ncbi:MAG: PASTA domain-containing protein [Acidimicrobiia bacterium]|nr:PASTA domain-containing protein [Acidimicrobiia bacterium]